MEDSNTEIAHQYPSICFYYEGTGNCIQQKSFQVISQMLSSSPLESSYSFPDLSASRVKMQCILPEQRWKKVLGVLLSPLQRVWNNDKYNPKLTPRNKATELRFTVSNQQSSGIAWTFDIFYGFPHAWLPSSYR